MIDLSNNERPFGLLSPEEQKAIEECPHGVECYHGEGDNPWGDHVKSWKLFAGTVYRTKPAPLTKPSIDWSVFTDAVICITRDSAGSFAWKGHPTYTDERWQTSNYDECNILVGALKYIASYSPGTCPDSEAIAYRPGCEPEGK